MIRLNLVSVGMLEETNNVILVLRAPEQERLLVMEIGILEGRAIALEAEGVKAPRPLTHDLMQQVIEELGASVAEVQILNFQDKTYFANLVLQQEGGKQVGLDARPSDAIALALRAGAPIYVDERVLAETGIDEQADVELETDSADSDLDGEEQDDEEDEEDEEESERVVH